MSGWVKENSYVHTEASVTNPSWTMDIASGSTLVVVFFASANASEYGLSALTCDGAAMTLLEESFWSNSSNKLQIWYRWQPSTGTALAFAGTGEGAMTEVQAWTAAYSHPNGVFTGTIADSGTNGFSTADKWKEQDVVTDTADQLVLFGLSQPTTGTDVVPIRGALTEEYDASYNSALRLSVFSGESQAAATFASVRFTTDVLFSRFAHVAFKPNGTPPGFPWSYKAGLGGSTTATTSKTITLDIPAGTNFVYVAVGSWGSQAHAMTATCDGVSMTAGREREYSGDWTYTGIFYLANPNTGTAKDIVVNFGHSVYAAHVWVGCWEADLTGGATIVDDGYTNDSGTYTERLVVGTVPSPNSLAVAYSRMKEVNGTFSFVPGEERYNALVVNGSREWTLAVGDFGRQDAGVNELMWKGASTWRPYDTHYFKIQPSTAVVGTPDALTVASTLETPTGVVNHVGTPDALAAASVLEAPAGTTNTVGTPAALTAPSTLATPTGTHAYGPGTPDSLTAASVLETPSATLFGILEGWRWRLDDGTELTATWDGAQDTAATIPTGSPRRLRFVVNNIEDGERLRLVARKQGDTPWDVVA